MSATQKALNVKRIWAQAEHCLFHLSPEAGESVSPHI
jgi:hypothetical protein